MIDQTSGTGGIVAIGVSSATMMRCGLVMVVFLTGCSLPSQKADFDSIDPQERAKALAAAAASGDRSSIPHFIEMLSSDDPGMRMLAIRSLEHLTDQTLDYDYAAELPARQAGIDRWEAWYLENGVQPTGEATPAIPDPAGGKQNSVRSQT